MEDTTSPYSPPQQQGSGKKTLFIIIGILLVVAAVVGGIIMLQKPKEEQKKVEEVVKEEVEPTPTEKPEIDKETVKIQVQNGTGTPGEAGTAVEALVEGGYNTDNIKTANADEYDNTVTSISAKEGFEDVATDIKELLGSKFDDIKIKSSLDSDNEFDVVIVTGGEIYEEEPAPTTAVTTTVSPTTSETTTPTTTPSLTPSPTP